VKGALVYNYIHVPILVPVYNVLLNVRRPLSVSYYCPSMLILLLFIYLSICGLYSIRYLSFHSIDKNIHMHTYSTPVVL
jgi:hypothetical protein